MPGKHVGLWMTSEEGIRSVSVYLKCECVVVADCVSHGGGGDGGGGGGGDGGRWWRV